MSRPSAPPFRPLLHMGVGALAPALGLLTPPLALLGAGLGVVAGWVVLPLTPLEARLRRAGEPWLCGLRTYPVAVLLLVALLPPAEAAAAWGVLAFGDSLAALVGSRVRAPALFGHPKATWAGSGAYVLGGAAGALAVSQACAALAAATGWVEAGPVPGVAACLLAALAAAGLDLLPLRPDDNLPAALGAGGVLRLLRGVP